jgi:hypothetical protein
MVWITRDAEDERLDKARWRQFLATRMPHRQRTFFHVTERRNLPQIRAIGFLPSPKGDAGPGIYFYDNLEAAQEYPQLRPHDDPVILRLRSSLPVHSADQIRKVGWWDKDNVGDTYRLQHVWVYPTTVPWRPRRIDVADLCYDRSRRSFHGSAAGWTLLNR